MSSPLLHTPRFAAASDDARPLYVVTPDTLEDTLAQLPGSAATWARAQGVTAAAGEITALPGADGAPCAALIGFGTEESRLRGRFWGARAASTLPEGSYRLAQAGPADPTLFALGWLMEAYRFDRYRSAPAALATLVAPDGIDAAQVTALASSEFLIRDLINTPTSDMGPDALEAVTQELADHHGATLSVIRGDDLLAQNLPLIHTVGRAAAAAPRLLDLTWGSGPMLTLVGKGVCFDTGGLNLKPGSSMGLMKKDMGGAAHVLGLAHAIMTAGWPVRLRVLIPAVENNVAGNAFRPGDVLHSRKGLTIENTNTDAEGRLVLADALALAAEDSPARIISMATLTGAARVALGPDVVPFYTRDDRLADSLTHSAGAQADPLWRMPFHDPYDAQIDSPIADLDNAPMKGFAGSVTAALFLRRFVGDHPYAHFDLYGWQPKAAPARPFGGTGQAWRALFATLPLELFS